MSRPALLVAGLLAVAMAGCGTDYDGTRERAEELAAAYAYDSEGSLRDLGADGRAPTSRRSCQEHSGDPNTCPGG